MAILHALPPKTQPMDVLRTAVSALGAVDPDLNSNTPEANRRKAMRLTAAVPDDRHGVSSPTEQAQAGEP